MFRRLFILILLLALGYAGYRYLRPYSSRPATPEAILEVIWEHAAPKKIDPNFVYAIAMAESSLRPTAKTKVARGIMQLTKPTWGDMTDLKYRHAWNWEHNIEVAVDYLQFCKEHLERNGGLSYPVLAGCYRFGPTAMKRRGYRTQDIETPNKIYKKLFAGERAPVKTPKRPVGR